MSLMHTEPWETSIVHVGFWLRYSRMTHAQKNIRASGKGNCVYVHWPLRTTHTSKGGYVLPSCVCGLTVCPQNNSNNYCGRILMNFTGVECVTSNDPDPRTFSGIFTICGTWGTVRILASNCINNDYRACGSYHGGGLRRLRVLLVKAVM